MAYKQTQQPTGRLKQTTAKTKRPSNSSTGSSIDQKKPTKFMKPAKKKATQRGYDSRNARGVKKLNKSAQQTMLRPGLVTSKASGG
jgi:hypothetical protein